jgi:hypothetical protein
MTNAKHTRPAVITAVSSKAHLVRQVAAELGLIYEELSVPGRDGLTKFTFSEIDDETTRKLVTSIPRDAYAYRAELGTAPATGSGKRQD